MKISFGDKDLITYLDSDLAGDIDDIKSTLSYLATHSGGVVAWKSRLRKCVWH
jgi:hypothetical protein